MIVGKDSTPGGDVVHISREIPDALADEIHRLGLDTVEGAFAFAKGEDLHKAGLGHRRRTRLELTDGDGNEWTLYLKRYGQQSLTRRLKQAVRARLVGRRPGSPAETEFENVRLVRRAKVRTMQEIAYGQESDWLGARRSFLLVTAVPGDALERRLPVILDRERVDGPTASELCPRLANLAAKLHRANLFHRDFYTSHIFLAPQEDSNQPGAFELYLIDLARVLGPWTRGFRWQVKDLAQLRYSLPAEWTDRWWEELLEVYLDAMAQQEQRDAFDRAIRAKVGRMERHDRRRRRPEADQ